MCGRITSSQFEFVGYVSFIIYQELNQNIVMQGHHEADLCVKCGNNHIGLCSSEISYFTYYPESQQVTPKLVEIVGEWYKWQNREIMESKTDSQGKVFYWVSSNVPVGRFQYKFIVDGKWTYDEKAPHIADPFGSFNNYIEVLPKKALVQYTPRQDIKLTSSLSMKDLIIVGSWDNWNGETKMELAFNNLKGCQQNVVYLELIPNTTYQFKFKYMNQYLIDQKYPTVPNQYGGFNNRIFICSENMNTPTGWRINKSTSINFNCRSFEWEKVSVESNYCEYKQSLDGHSMCQIGEFLYIFGGRIHNSFTNRLTKVNIHKLGIMHPEQIVPNERAFHFAAVYGNKMIIFGGHNKVILQDYNVFNTTDRVWLPSPQIKGKFPSKREKQTCVLYQTLLIFFGGYYCSHDFEFESTYNDIQVLDIEQMKWIDEDLIKVAGRLPQPRFSHASALIHSTMYIFGGKNVHNQKGRSCHSNFNDIWALNMEKVEALQWEQIKPKGQPPAPRHGHTMNSLNHYLIIFGGENNQKTSFNDVIVFDTEKAEWIYPVIKCKTPNCSPYPRAYHAATVVNNQYIVIFGGKNLNPKSTSFYVLKPKDIKLDLDIEQEDEISQDQVIQKKQEQFAVLHEIMMDKKGLSYREKRISISEEPKKGEQDSIMQSSMPY